MKEKDQIADGESRASKELSESGDVATGRLFEEVCRLSSFLRSKDGCSWDRAQTLGSMTPYLLEEACEAIEAVESGDMDKLREELGDLVYLIIFMADIARSQGAFTTDQVFDGIRSKLYRRHPHVFGKQTALSPEQVKSQWETIKKSEGGSESILKEYPASMPGLIQAYRIQEKAAAVGFDWEKTEQVIEKVREELGEVKAACSREEPEDRSAELGDLLFAVVNLCRFVGTDPERAVKASVDKFRRRFRYIEEQLAKRGSNPAASTLQEMDEFWNEAKRRGI
jgi:tetrapyrrole methylase family protein/MazG family protein